MLKGSLAQFGAEQEGEQNSASHLWGKPDFSQELETACCLAKPPGRWDDQAQGDQPKDWLNTDRLWVEGQDPAPKAYQMTVFEIPSILLFLDFNNPEGMGLKHWTLWPGEQCLFGPEGAPQKQALSQDVYCMTIFNLIAGCWKNKQEGKTMAPSKTWPGKLFRRFKRQWVSRESPLPWPQPSYKTCSPSGEN